MMGKMSRYIRFRDPEAERYCMKFSSDGIGVTIQDVAKVTEIPSTIGYSIVSFDELRHFKGAVNIVYNAFSGKTTLRQITIPENVVTIGYNAFGGCNSLERVVFLPIVPIDDGRGGYETFYGAPFDTCEVYVPYSVNHSILAAYKSTYYRFKNIFELNPNGIIPNK